MNKFRLSLIFLSLILLTACKINGTYLNREEDKKEAEIVTNEFFSLLKAQDYEGTTKLFSDRFFQVSNKDKLFEIYKLTNRHLGNLKTIGLEKWETKRVEGSNPSADYAFLYKNTYDNFQCEEIIKLTKEKDGSIKILAYNINSNGFLKE